MIWFRKPHQSEWNKIVERPQMDTSHLKGLVEEVFHAVKERKDQALLEFTERFDQVSLDSILVSQEEVEEGVQLVEEQLKSAIDVAYDNIITFHAPQLKTFEKIETTVGVFCWRKQVPIQKVGIYIPGGTAPLFSTVLMLAIPAQIAKCKEIVLCTPPNSQGKIHPAILYVAKKCGITKICKVGGSQAIAAMALGTESVPNVYKIFGPGNQFVTEAKLQAQAMGLAIDMPAGPSEVLVIADENADPQFVAADLLAQAEHGADSQVICVSHNEQILEQVEEAVKSQLSILPRKSFAAKSLESSALVLLPKSQIMDFVNAYAPEHLILSTDDTEFYLNQIENAGSVFIGHYTPESMGDYASGTNHTLPTNGFARQYSGVSVDSFVKNITFQEVSKEGLKNLGPTVEIMAKHEGLDAHKNAVSLRLQKLQNE